MPQMGYDMQEGTVVRWLMSEGSEVKAGEPIAEIETDKAVVEFESTAPGVLRRILVSEGTTVPVGQPIAVIAAADEEMPEAAAAPQDELDSEQSAPEAEPESPAEEPTGIPLPPSPSQAEPPPAAAPEVRASPVARRLAQERGLDLLQVEATGPGGRITRDDVLNFEPPEPEAAPAPEPEAAPAPEPEAAPAPEPEAAPAPAPAAEVQAAPPVEAPAPALPEAPPNEEMVPLSRMRQQIARVTVRSKQEVPHFYVSVDVDMTRAMELRRQLNEASGQDDPKISVNDLVIAACVGALKKYPKFNASFAGDSIRMSPSINVGIAIAEEAGLIVPAILDAGNKSLSQISAASKDLAERAKGGTLHPQEYTGGTFSISNMGMFGVTSFVAIIHPPNTAVLAVGRVEQSPVVRDGQVTVAETMATTLSVDHRVADGAEGARFIMEVKRQLENPISLLV